MESVKLTCEFFFRKKWRSVTWKIDVNEDTKIPEEIQEKAKRLKARAWVYTGPTDLKNFA